MIRSSRAMSGSGGGGTRRGPAAIGSAAGMAIERAAATGRRRGTHSAGAGRWPSYLADGADGVVLHDALAALYVDAAEVRTPSSIGRDGDDHDLAVPPFAGVLDDAVAYGAHARASRRSRSPGA